MSTVTIYGESDDLIELDGDLYEEISPGYEADTTVLSFSDGTVLTISYVSGFWRINTIVKGTATLEKVEGTDDEDDYSDRVTLTGDIQWCVPGWTFYKVKVKTA